MGWAINVWFLLRRHNRWTVIGSDTWPQLWWKAQVLPGLACERVKHNSSLGRCCFLTLTRKFLPRFLSAKVGNDSLETLFTFPPRTISDTLSSWKAGFKPCNSHSKSAKQKDREGGREGEGKVCREFRPVEGQKDVILFTLFCNPRDTSKWIRKLWYELYHLLYSQSQFDLIVRMATNLKTHSIFFFKYRKVFRLLKETKCKEMYISIA